MSKENGKILTVNYQEVPLVKVLKHFGKGFKHEDGSKTVVRFEAFIDVVRGVVVYKLYVEESDDKKTLILPTPDAFVNS